MVHNELSKTFSCTYCSAIYVRHSQLEAHIRLHTGERPFSCKCGRTYARKQHLSRHASKCSLLDSSANPSEANNHSLGQSDPKIYSCPQCGAGPFKKKKFVWAHVAIVHSERNHKCDKCSRAFPTLSKLKRHSTKHHGYACPYCTVPTDPVDLDQDTVLRFDSFVALRRHIADQHPKSSHQCPTCGLKFNRPSALSEHELTHTPGDISLRRRFVCPLCPGLPKSESNSPGPSSSAIGQPVAFTAKRNLDAHMRSVHANLTFACPWPCCPVLLSTKQKLDQHLERHKSGRRVAYKTRKRWKHNLFKESGDVEKEVKSEDCWETDSQNSILAILDESDNRSKTE